MTQQVTDDLLSKIARQQNNLFRMLKEGTLDPEKISRGLRELIKGSVLSFQYDMRKKGWKLLEDVKEKQTFFRNYGTR